MPDVANFSSPATDPLRNFRFLVCIAPYTTTEGWVTSSKWNSYLGFTSVSGLAMTIDSIPYREGGYNTTVHQIPGQASFSPITLSRGVTIGTKQNYVWTQSLFSTVLGTGSGQPGVDFRAKVFIKVLDHPVTTASPSGTSTYQWPPVKVAFTVHNAWITSLAYSDLNAGDNALLVEQMTIAHEGFEMKFADSVGTTAPLTPY